MKSEEANNSGFALSTGRRAAIPTAGFVPPLFLGQIQGNRYVCGRSKTDEKEGWVYSGRTKGGRRKPPRTRQTRARLEAGDEDNNAAHGDARTRNGVDSGRNDRSGHRERTDDDRRSAAIDTINAGTTNGETDEGKVRRGRKQVRRTLSSESRAKISDALKGRRKSESHKQNLSKRFTGSGNPMYGRKRSAETRAKISAALLARRHEKEKKDGKKVISNLPEEGLLESQITPAMRKIKQQAIASRLVSSLTTGGNDRRNPDSTDERIDNILKRVANLDAPPDNVAKLIQETEVKRRNGENDKDDQTAKIEDGGVIGALESVKQDMPRIMETERKATKKRNGRRKTTSIPCSECDGRGMTMCERCVGTFGVTSMRCSACFGAGSVFCRACDGAGQTLPDT